MSQATEAAEAEVNAATAAVKALSAESEKRRAEGTLEMHAAGLVSRSVTAHDHKVTTHLFGYIGFGYIYI